MFEKGKVYKTVEGKPAKILWVSSSQSETQSMFVLHNSYTKAEDVLEHDLDGIYMRVMPDFNLTTEEYK
ncbi:MAG TPA: hypothetical protein PLP33_27740 [Leptospiraceae bacterium]|nr:hypothetical protein [Leptospiraceae bacterium]